MGRYKYYVTDYCTGTPREIYRTDDVPFGSLGPEDGFWRAKADGSWSDEEREVRPLLNLWLKGDFDPKDDGISEERAATYLREWGKPGCWPGRP